MPLAPPAVRASLLGLLLAGACASPPVTRVEQEWSETMRRFSVIGLYPITEDLQPGDILLDLPAASGGDPQPRLQRLGSVDLARLTTALEASEKRRLRFEALKPEGQQAAPAADKPAERSTVATTVNAATGDAVTTSTTVRPGRAQGGGNANARGGGATKPKSDADVPAPPHVLGADSPQRAANMLPRMRRVALPGVTAARVFDWQLGAAGPFARVALALGLRGNGAAAVLVHLKGLELVGFDSFAALRFQDEYIIEWLQGTPSKQGNYSPGRLLRLVQNANPDAARRICRNEALPGPDERSVIRVVNRVLYAHDIEYEYTRSSEFAGRFAADVAQGAANRVLVPSSGAAAAALPTIPSATAGAGGAADAEAARIQALLSSLAANSPSTPGVRATVGIGTYGNAALKEHYLQPMAVGFIAASTFTVRSSLVLTGRSKDVSSEQLREAREICRAFFTETEAASAPLRQDFGKALSPVEQLICGNTRFAQARPKGSEIALAAACEPLPGGDLRSPPNGGSLGAFLPAGPQRRDANARSLAL